MFYFLLFPSLFAPLGVLPDNEAVECARLNDAGTLRLAGAGAAGRGLFRLALEAVRAPLALEAGRAAEDAACR